MKRLPYLGKIFQFTNLNLFLISITFSFQILILLHLLHMTVEHYYNDYHWNIKSPGWPSPVRAVWVILEFLKVKGTKDLFSFSYFNLARPPFSTLRTATNSTTNHQLILLSEQLGYCTCWVGLFAFIWSKHLSYFILPN